MSETDTITNVSTTGSLIIDAVAEARARDIVEAAQAHAIAQRPMSDAAALIDSIRNAARDPNVDVEKMERLMKLYERIREIDATQAYNAAFAAMQIDLPDIEERGTGDGSKWKFALWEDVNRALRPVLGKHGFAISHRVEQTDKQIVVTGVLSHRDGHSERTTLALPIDNTGSKNAVQAIGSSVMYGRRYTAFALLNLSSGLDDDDGKATSGGFISPDQIDTLTELVKKTGADETKLMAFFKIANFKELREGQYREAVEKINLKYGTKKAKTDGDVAKSS